MRTVTGILLALMMLASCACAEPVRIMVVSDLHYLAEELYVHSTVFPQLLLNGDGKASQYSGELLEALILEVQHVHPDALVLTGDLTFNGELLSHEHLASGMQRIRESGIPVYVIPGNHDISNRNAGMYAGSMWTAEKNVTPEAFGNVWEGMTRESEAGYTFGVNVGENVYLILVDASVYRKKQEAWGEWTESHTRVFTQEMEKARGRTVICFTHQNLLPHVRGFEKSMTVHGGEKMRDMMLEAGAVINVSGHMHIQHILQGTVTDAALSAYCMWPHRYGLLTVEGSSIVFEAGSLCPEHLPDGLWETTRVFFLESAHRKNALFLPEDMPEEEKQAALEYAGALHLAYFSGTVSEQWESLCMMPGREIWQGQPSEGFADYLLRMEQEKEAQHLVWTFE